MNPAQRRQKRNNSRLQTTQYVPHRLGEEISYALLEAGLVVVVLLPRDQGERVQDLHDDLKEVGRRNLWKDFESNCQVITTWYSSATDSLMSTASSSRPSSVQQFSQ